MMDTPASSPISERIHGLAEPLARSMGLEVWGVEFQPAGRSILRIYLEGPKGVGIDECAEFSRLIGLTLDVEDCIPSAYALEVSSPGLERVFFEPGQLEPYAGADDILDLTLHHPPPGWPGRKKFTGRLVSAAQGGFIFQPVDKETMAPQGEAFRFTWPESKKIRRVYYVPPPQKPGGRKTAAKKTPPVAGDGTEPGNGSGGSL